MFVRTVAQNPPPKPTGLTALALLLVSLVVARPAPAERLHLTSPRYLQIIIVDTETQEIDEVLPDPYPRIINVYNAYVEDDNSLLLATANAVQQPGVNRMIVSPRSFQGISGYVEGVEFSLRGTGPLTALRPGTLLLQGDDLYQLTRTVGLLEISLTSGNRRLISSSNEDVLAGSGPPMLRPSDMIITHDGRLLVLDLFEGLLEIDPVGGARTQLFNGGQLPIGAQRMDLLPDGRVVFVSDAVDIPCVWVMEINSGRAQLLTGAFGGIEVGTGPEFQLATDVTVSPQGRLYVYDSLRPAILEVSLDGQRTIVVEEQPDEPIGLFRAEDRPGFANARPPAPKGRQPTGWVLP
jgi:hypothetical protein